MAQYLNDSRKAELLNPVRSFSPARVGVTGTTNILPEWMRIQALQLQ
jgi:hypothetical protein